jgi:hypothetical protein
LGQIEGSDGCKIRVRAVACATIVEGGLRLGTTLDYKSPKVGEQAPIAKMDMFAGSPFNQEGNATSHTLQHPGASMEALRDRGVPINEIILV